VTIALCRAGRSGKPQHPFDRRASGDCNVHRAALAAGEPAGGAGCAGAETPRCVWHGELRAAVTASCAPPSVFVFTSVPSPPRGCYSWPYSRRKGGHRQGRQARFAIIVREMPSRPPPTRTTVHRARSSRSSSSLRSTRHSESLRPASSCEQHASSPWPVTVADELRLLGHVWFYNGQGQRRECVDSAAGGGIPDCAHAVEETPPGSSAAPAPRRFMAKRPGPPATDSLRRALRACSGYCRCSTVAVWPRAVQGQPFTLFFQDRTRSSALAVHFSAASTLQG
jgi:hypothetical protein